MGRPSERHDVRGLGPGRRARTRASKPCHVSFSRVVFAVVDSSRESHMGIRGWVYVLSNRAMPGLVKVGFSTKDPVLRTAQLDGTGLPHPFEVEYDALVSDPRDVEQLLHERLADTREAKEFFRASVEVVTEALYEVLVELGKEILLEQWREGAEPAHKNQGPYFTVAGAPPSPPRPSSYRPDTGTMEYICAHCGHSTTLASSHLARCSYCGRTEVLR